MPKAKTHRGAAKRFRVTGSGKIMMNRAWRSHLLGKKSSRRKRRLRQPVVVSKSEWNRIRRRVERLAPFG